MMRNVILLLIAIFVGQFVRQNPLLWGQSVGEDNLPSQTTFPIYRDHVVLDTILEYHRQEIDTADYDKYRNHCLRVLAFAGYYYLQEAAETGAQTGHEQDNFDDNKPNLIIDDHVLDVMALALAYHDIGLWTAGELDYLEPSVVTLDQDWLIPESDDSGDTEEDAKPLLRDVLSPITFSEADLETARQIILQHHKVKAWKTTPSMSSRVDVAAVNAVRRGDWADATLGMVRSGLPASYLEQAYRVLPEAGFHAMLADMTGRLSPNSIMGRFQVLKILKW